MEKRLHQLETFAARGSDGHVYRVHGYEILARTEAVRDFEGQWEPTGEAEYLLDDGRIVHVARDGAMSLDNGVTLQC